MKAPVPERIGRFHAPEEGFDRASLTALQERKLACLLSEILPRNRFYSRKLSAAGIDPRRKDLASLEGLRRLPFTTKAEIQEDQAAHPPFGTNLGDPPERYTRLHQTSGTTGRPIRWLDTPESWSWLLHCWGSIFRAAGLGPGDRLMVPFSFGPFIGFWAAFEGALRLGMMALPGGGMSSAARLRFLVENGATALISTPTYALRLLEVAREEGIDLPRGPVKALIVAGEPGGCIPSVRERIEAGWGARCFDHWGMTEVGPLGFEACEAPGAMLLLETECIPEVLDARGEPAPPGERGELVITTLGRTASPLLRYRTGDLVSCLAGPCPSGRSFLRLAGGILGRIDDMVLVRGNNVYPSAIESVLRSLPEVSEYQALVTRRGGASADLRLRVEPVAGADPVQVAERVRRAMQEALCFRPEVELAPPGGLPRFEMKAKRFTYREGP